MNDLVGQVREQIKDIRNSQRSIKGETEDLHQQTAKQPQLTRADDSRRRTGGAAGDGRFAGQAGGGKAGRSAAADGGESLDGAGPHEDDAQTCRDDLNQVAEHPMKDAAGSDRCEKSETDPQTNRQAAGADRAQ